MCIKKFINKVKESHNKIKEENLKKNQVSNTSDNKKTPDNILLKESSKKGIGLREDIFIPIIEEKKVSVSEYIVQKDDTLELIAHKIYNDSSKWIMLHNANIIKIPNPNNLFEGIVLNIPKENEFDNFYPITKNGNYIIQPNDDLIFISEKIFKNKSFSKKIIDWNFFKYKKDIYPSKEVKNLKYLDFERQLIKLSKKYLEKPIEKDILVTKNQEHIILTSIAEIARLNKVPPIIALFLSEVENYWMNCQYTSLELEDNNLEWKPMQINEHNHPEAFPRIVMDLEYNIEYGVNIIKDLKKTQKTWAKVISSYTLTSPLGIGKPEEQKEKAKKSLLFLEKVINKAKDKNFEKRVISLIKKDDALDISYSLLLSELSEFRTLIKTKYL